MLVVCAPVIGASGCRHAPKEVVPIEELVLKPRRSSDDLVAATQPHNGYVTLVSDPTVGLPPGALAIARVAPTEAGPDTPDAPAELAMTPPNEMMDWMDLFDDTWAISEVFPVTYPVRPTRAVPPRELVDYARTDDAALCLVYCIDRSEDTISETTEVRGALYDARTGNLLARMQAEARVLTLEEDQSPPPPPPDRAEPDLRHIDSWFIAQERFREHVRHCVTELVAQDQHIGPRSDMRRQTAFNTASPYKQRRHPPGAQRTRPHR